jgi:hypothetical protein
MAAILNFSGKYFLVDLTASRRVKYLGSWPSYQKLSLLSTRIRRDAKENNISSPILSGRR